MSFPAKLIAALPSPAVLTGSACALLSLMLAARVWQRTGNPAVLLVWLATAAALVAYARAHRRWHAAFARIAAQRPHTPLRSSGRTWDGRAEEVVFVELPDAKEVEDVLAAPAGMAA